MDDTDRRIIAGLQAGLSDSPAPYAAAAEPLGITEDELLRRLRAMRKSGLLRRVRAVIDQRLVGLEGNVLVAWSVDESRADEAARAFAGRSEVTHCVLRDAAPGWPYNLYTMIHAGTNERCLEIVRQMQASSGLAEPVALVTVRELKKTPTRYF